jgi:outer membrane protein assembly factor BamE (lipoprotein component of BamABCDE complex)
VHAEIEMPAAGERNRVHFFAALFAALPLAGCIGYDGVVNRGAVVEPRKLAQVKPGATAQQTLSILGTPSTTSTVGGEAWYYVSQRTERQLAFMNPKVTDQHVLALYFDKDKKVQRVADYGLEDGKLVDFQSRITPPAGGDAGFVRGLLNSASGLWPF